MNRRLILLPFLMLTFLVCQVSADDTDWTEKKLGKIILKANRAAQQKKWPRAIKYGEQMLMGAQALNQHSDVRYISLLKNLNIYYEKSGRLQEAGPKIKEAYMLSKKHLGATHETTITSRNIFYKLLIAVKDFHGAIQLVEENIVIFENRENEDYRVYHYLTQLFSLYGITNQFKKEEKILLRLLDMNQRLLGKEDQDNAKIIMNLAKNYCRQKETIKFNQIVKAHNLKYICK